MSMKRRQEIAQEFAQGKHPMLICGIAAMSEGIDGLQRRASYLAFTELGWNPSVHAQAASRLHRNGQTKPVTGYYLVAADTIDERMAELVDAKSSVVSASVGEMDPRGVLESIIDWVVA